jgi:hypothetical protein
VGGAVSDCSAPPIQVTVEYSDLFGGAWCAVLECPDDCECGERLFHPFASKAQAVAFRDYLVGGWPSSPEAKELRRDVEKSMLGGAS